MQTHEKLTYRNQGADAYRRYANAKDVGEFIEPPKNPYPQGSEKHGLWEDGYLDAMLYSGE